MPPSQVAFEAFCGQAYSDACRHYGDLDLGSATFGSHLAFVVQKHLGSDPAETGLVRLLETLHTRDLYLSVACALPIDKAWRRFESDYRIYIFRLRNRSPKTCKRPMTWPAEYSPTCFFPIVQDTVGFGLMTGNARWPPGCAS